MFGRRKVLRELEVGTDVRRVRKRLVKVVEKSIEYLPVRGVSGKFNVEYLLYTHLTSEGKKVIDKATLGGWSGLTLGVRQVLIAKLFRVKYAPADVFARTEDVIYDLYGYKLSYKSGAKVIHKLQPWNFNCWIYYKERGFNLSFAEGELEKVSGAEGYDIASFIGVPLRAYFQGVEVLNKLSKADKAVLISSLIALDHKLKLVKNIEKLGVTERNAVTTVHDVEAGKVMKKPEEKKEGGGTKEVKESGGASEEERSKVSSSGRPLLDGYVKVEYADPELSKFSNAVRNYLSNVELAKKVWEGVEECVKAVAPSYYNFLGFDAEKHLPKAVAEAVLELTKLYLKLSKAKKLITEGKAGESEVIKELVKELEPIYGAKSKEIAVTLVMKLVQNDLHTFIKTRTPYLISLIGEKVGTAFKLSTVYDFITANPAEKAVLKTLLKLGIVALHKDVTEITKVGRLWWEEASKFMEGSYLSRSATYAHFYALGIPVTRVFASGEPPFTDFQTVVNVKQFIKTPEIFYVSTGLHPSELGRVGNIFFSQIDRVINAYINHAFNNCYESSKHEKLITYPELYQSILYIFSDRDYDNGLNYSILREPSTHTKLLDCLREIAVYGVEAKVYEYATLGWGEEKAKARYYREQREKALRKLSEAKERIIKLAKIYNPKYIRYLHYKSVQIYDKYIDIEEKNKTSPEELENIPANKKIKEYAETLKKHINQNIIEQLKKVLEDKEKEDEIIQLILERKKKKKEEEKKEEEEKKKEEKTKTEQPEHQKAQKS